MKRSKIVDIIADYFYHCNLDQYEANELADKLLTTLEGKGMLTPDYSIKDEGVFVQSFHSIKSVKGKWEDE